MAAKTWRETLDHLSPWYRGACINEAMVTHFVAPIPDELSFLGGGLADLGFDNLDLPPQEQNKLLLAFVGSGVRVPRTAYRIRNWGIASFVESADGSEEAVLPADWKQGLLMPTREHDAYLWIGKRVPKITLDNVDLIHYQAVDDGWIPRSGGK